MSHSCLAYPRGMKLSELASTLGCELRGDGRLEITGVAGMEHATSHQLTFLSNPKYGPRVKHTRAGAILVSQPIEDLSAAQLISTNPYLDVARALALFYQPPRPKPGIHPLASVAASASVGEGCSIGPFAAIGE